MMTDTDVIQFFENHNNYFHLNLTEPTVLSNPEKKMLKWLERKARVRRDCFLFPVKIIKTNHEVAEGFCKTFVIDAEIIENNETRGGIIIQNGLIETRNNERTIATRNISEIYIYKPIVYTEDLCYSLSYI